MQEIFRFVPTGVDGDGRVRGHFECTGIVPRCIERIRLVGVEISNSLFERGRRLEGGHA